MQSKARNGAESLKTPGRSSLSFFLRALSAQKGQEIVMVISKNKREK